jgi:hypothetical protein
LPPLNLLGKQDNTKLIAHRRARIKIRAEINKIGKRKEKNRQRNN